MEAILNILCRPWLDPDASITENGGQISLGIRIDLQILDDCELFIVDNYDA